MANVHNLPVLSNLEKICFFAEMYRDRFLRSQASTNFDDNVASITTFFMRTRPGWNACYIHEFANMLTRVVTMASARRSDDPLLATVARLNILREQEYPLIHLTRLYD